MSMVSNFLQIQRDELDAIRSCYGDRVNIEDIDTNIKGHIIIELEALSQCSMVHVTVKGGMFNTEGGLYNLIVLQKVLYNFVNYRAHGIGLCHLCGYSFCRYCSKDCHGIEAHRFNEADRVRIIEEWESGTERDKLIMSQRKMMAATQCTAQSVTQRSAGFVMILSALMKWSIISVLMESVSISLIVLKGDGRVETRIWSIFLMVAFPVGAFWLFNQPYIFKEFMKDQFRKAFPLRGETFASRPTPVATPSTSQITKRLNFDDSFSTPSVLNLNAQMCEAKEEIDLLKRKLLNARTELDRIKDKDKERILNIEKLQNDIFELKKQLVIKEQNTELKAVKSRICEAERLLEEWREVGNRFHRYFKCTKARLLVAQEVIQSNNLWTDDVKHKLSTAWNTTECNVARLEDCDLDVVLTDISIISAVNDENGTSCAISLEGKDCEKPIFNCKIGTDESGDVLNGGGSIDIFRHPLSPILSGAANSGQAESSFTSIMNSTLANTSIDYIKDEKIERMDLENSLLKDRQLSILQKAELESLRSACANKIFDSIEGSSEERAAEFIKRVQELTLRTRQQEKELEVLTKDRDNLSKRVDYLNRDNADLEETLSDEKSSKESLSRDIDEKSALLKSAMETITSLKHDICQLSEDLSRANVNIKSLESQLKVASQDKEGTDAGENTKIFHMQMNPLQEAMDKLREEEDKHEIRKRKAEENESEDPHGAKRSKNERIDALENQLKKSQKEKDLAVRMQSEIAKKYRSVTYRIHRRKTVDTGIFISCHTPVGISPGANRRIGENTYF
uniref:C2H2-type domain-containing protein n=1 Tax=Heterorhabditis bacteriophora TaxID=37862 RepID=A0A1I7XUC5_HETBA